MPPSISSHIEASSYEERDVFSGFSWKELSEKLKRAEITSERIVRICFERVYADQKKFLSENSVDSDLSVKGLFKENKEEKREQEALNACIELFSGALEQAQRADLLRAQGDRRPLLGLPVMIKDNILIKGQKITCASKMLQGFVSPYSATVVERLEEQGAIIIGRTNMDEFAMGSTNEYSIYGPVLNLFDPGRVAGGSSGGSAASVASGMVSVALGSDTGGSVRVPAAFNGVYGLKPEFGTFSRYGVVNFASDFDQVGVFATHPADLYASLLSMGGEDGKDQTVKKNDFHSKWKSFSWDLERLEKMREDVQEKESFRSQRVIFLDFPGEKSESVQEAIRMHEDYLREQGFEIEWVRDLKILEASFFAYYVLVCAYCSSNLARFDAMRYGLQNFGEDWEKMMSENRAEGFGFEVKKRIVVGNAFFSSAKMGEFYLQAQVFRKEIAQFVQNLLERACMIVCPTSFVEPFKLKEKLYDTQKMSLSDVSTMFVNLSGAAGLSLPFFPPSFDFKSERGKKVFPVGMQWIARDQEKMLLEAWRLHEHLFEDASTKRVRPEMDLDLRRNQGAVI